MIVRKEKELIIFDFENGKTATYNMNTGETIGKMGKPVKSLCAALSGYDITYILNSFEDKKYAEFLKYVHDKLTPQSYRYYSRGSRVTNLGSLFKYANRYKNFEGYMLAGVKAYYDIHTPIKDVPKGLLKLCREYNREINDRLIKDYNAMPNEYQMGLDMASKMEFESIDVNCMFRILEYLAPNRYEYSAKLLTEFKYNFKSLLKYIDYLMTFEGIDSCYLVREIGDYANMMAQISRKFEKYPRYFLSTHKIAARNYTRLKKEFSEKIFATRIKPEYEITHGEYKFFYPKCTQDIKDEAVQQQNCVASYIDKVVDGRCDILFLRKKDNPTKSVVTIEVRDGTIVQAFQAYNTPCTEEQREAIKAFNKKFSKEK